MRSALTIAKESWAKRIKLTAIRTMWKAAYYRKQAEACLAIARMLPEKTRAEQFTLAASKYLAKAEKAERESKPQAVNS
jgi:hypothetical protein